MFPHREKREAPLTLGSQRGINRCLCIKPGDKVTVILRREQEPVRTWTWLYHYCVILFHPIEH